MKTTYFNVTCKRAGHLLNPIRGGIMFAKIKIPGHVPRPGVFIKKKI